MASAWVSVSLNVLISFILLLVHVLLDVVIPVLAIAYDLSLDV